MSSVIYLPLSLSPSLPDLAETREPGENRERMNVKGMDFESMADLLQEVCEEMLEETDGNLEVAFDLVKGSSTCDDCYEFFKGENSHVPEVQVQSEFYETIRRTLKGLQES